MYMYITFILTHIDNALTCALPSLEGARDHAKYEDKYGDLLSWRSTRQIMAIFDTTNGT